MNINIRRAFPAIMLTMVVFLLVPVTGLAELTETQVAESLTCYACPGESLSIDRCSGGYQMRAAINRMIKEGKSKPQILNYFVAEFGDSILTTVPKKGFNLIAYTGPFISLLIGIFVAVLILRRWGAAARKASIKDRSTEQQPAQLDEKTRLQIEKELTALDEED